MRSLYLSLFFLASFVHVLNAQNWDRPPPADGRFLFVRALEPYVDQGVTWTPIEMRGGVPRGELIYHGLPNMAAGTDEARYFVFSGDYYVTQVIIEGETHYFFHPTFGWPGGIIKPEDLIPPYPHRFGRTYYMVSNGCWYGAPEEMPDSVRLADGYGYWELVYPPGGQPHYDGYVDFRCHPHPTLLHPCQGGGGPVEKRDFVFTDSLYNELPERSVISGLSKLYFKADSPSGYLGTYAKLYLATDPDEDTSVAMTYNGDGTWRGSLESPLLLGLKSYNLVKGEFFRIWPDSTEHFWG
jgi:hypothetical protein